MNALQAILNLLAIATLRFQKSASLPNIWANTEKLRSKRADIRYTYGNTNSVTVSLDEVVAK